MYALLLRKIKYNNTMYYQALDKVIGEENFNNVLEVVDGKKHLNQYISPIEDINARLVYFEISKEAYDEVSLNPILLFKGEPNNLEAVSNPLEYNEVVLALHNEYHDFRLIPDYSIETLINDVLDDLEDKVIGQDLAIKKVLRKIYDNHMYFESDLSYDDIYKNKSNILLVGPFGTGKSTILNSVFNNLSPIPVLYYSLTGNLNYDLAEITRKLWMLAGGNKYLAERGIVVFDGINSYSTKGEDGNLISFVPELHELLKARDVYLSNQNNEIVKFNYSLITNVCLVDMNYDFEKGINYDDLYYSKVYGKNFVELGFTFDMVENYFDNEAIFMDEMTRDLAIEILKTKETSPLYKMKKMLEGRGKIVKISKDFIDNLVDYGLDFSLGFSGIERTLKYLLQKKDMSVKTINFTGDEVFDLQIGTINPYHSIDTNELYEENDMDVKENIHNKPKTKRETKIEDGLDVDLIKRTINGLSVIDVVDKLKEKIIGQDEQLFMIVNAFYNHILNRHKGYTNDDISELKRNVLLIANTGTGKTAILKNLSKIFNIPYVLESAPRFTKAGYVGEDVDSIFINLIKAAGGDVEKAKYGIIMIDELDKIPTNKTDGVDVSGAVQDELLTALEGDRRIITKRNGFGEEKIEFDTSNILFIGSGAFEGLKEITEKRIKKEQGLSTMGFKTGNEKKEIITDVTNDDLEKYGMGRQFGARFPRKIRLNNMDVELLYNIINNQNGGFVHLNVDSYLKSGIVVEMSESFKRSLAEEVFKLKEGARGIRTVFSDIMDEIDHNIVNGDVQKIVLDGDCIHNPKGIQYIKRKK